MTGRSERRAIEPARLYKTNIAAIAVVLAVGLLVNTAFLVGVPLSIVVICWALRGARVRAVVTSDEIVVRNPFWSYRIARDEVVDVRSQSTVWSWSLFRWFGWRRCEIIRAHGRSIGVEASVRPLGDESMLCELLGARRR